MILSLLLIQFSALTPGYRFKPETEFNDSRGSKIQRFSSM